MARSMMPNSAGSQFFIMHEDSPHLDGEYAAFGKVIEGQDVVNRIALTKTGWADDFATATLTIRCTASTVCPETHVIEDVPVTWEVQAKDILYTAETEFEGKTYTDTTTGPKLSVILSPGNGTVSQAEDRRTRSRCHRAFFR